MLWTFDASTVTGAVYTALIAHPGSTQHELVSVTSLAAEQVRASLETLCEQGLAGLDVADDEKTWEPVPPDLTVDRLIE
ncbi:hypothetical protein [Amycolatopsis sp. NPDC051372]|uniref:hypothetical protein n=1 Tax=Amycolatopsis sp. NPDC051372 TaxID=3155669 RepID=UPI0034487BB6